MLIIMSTWVEFAAIFWLSHNLSINFSTVTDQIEQWKQGVVKGGNLFWFLNSKLAMALVKASYFIKMNNML